MLTKQDAVEALSRAMHPEIDYSLLELGMIKEVVVQQDKITLTMNLPFPEIPIRDLLVRIVKDGIAKADPAAQVEMDFAVMDQAEREEFQRKAQQRWKL